MNNTAKTRLAIREQLAGQLLMPYDSLDLQTMIALQELIDKALALRCGMLFAVFTGFNSTFMLRGNYTINGLRRFRKILSEPAEKWLAWERKRRQSHQVYLKSLCQSAPTE